MLPNRPRPVRLNAAPRSKPKPRAAPKASKGGKTNRPKRPQRKESSAPYWIAGILILLLVAILVIAAEIYPIRALLNRWEHPELAANHAAREGHHPEDQDERLARTEAHLQAKNKKRAQELAAKQAAHPVAPAPLLPKPALAPVLPVQATPPVVAAPPLQHPESLPPVVHPAPVLAQGVPARALPLDPNKLDTERIAAYQVALERMHFSCGFIDGNQGIRTQRMLRAFQGSHNLPPTGFLDLPTREAIGEPGEPFLSYVVTAQDIGSVMPAPAGWKAKSEAKRLGYNTIWELLAEKFHCTRAYLKDLNHDVTEPVAGTEIIGPKVFPAAPIPLAASLRVSLADTSIEALDASGRVIAFFPCSIAKDKNKRPKGKLVVKSVVPDPDYTFDPALFKDSNEGLTHKLVLPPGPRNPVGVAWIGLSLPGYGIHGTPEPENISRTQSHGCFRLANWNAQKVLKLVKVGTPIDVEP